METWKGAAIGAMLLAIVGYGAIQNRSAQGNSEGDANRVPVPSALETPTPDPVLVAWIGKEPLVWSFPQASWANTPRPLTPADLKGKVTVLEFWRMNCPHCEDAVPFMNALKKQFGSRLQLITFQSPGALDDPENMENSWPDVQKWMAAHAVSYPVAFDEGRKLKNGYKINLYPFVLLVDKQGKIVYAHTGHTPDKTQALMKQIQKLAGK